MTNVTQESIELAQQLHALYDEALGYPYLSSWDSLQSNQREAWVQVAQFVEASKEATEYIFNDSNTKCPSCHKITDEPDHR